MKFFPRRFVVYTALLSIFPVSGSVAVSAHAQTSVQKKSAPDAGVRFQKYLDTFATKNKWAIVAEGAPLSLDEAFTNSDKYKRATPEAQFQIVADAADYEAKHTPNSPVWVLTKRYSSPRDMPCVTLAECTYSIQRVAGLTALLLPKTADRFGPEYDLVQGMYRGFTPQERQAALEKPISVASLQPQQKWAAQGVAAVLYLRHFPDDSKRQVDFLKQAGQARLSRVEKVSGKPKPIVWFGPKSAPKDGIALGGIGWLEVPKEGDVLPPPAPTTLGKEINRINAAEKAHVGLTCELDPALSDKLLTVAGLENTTTGPILKAFAEVYGLRLRTTNTAHILGFRPEWKNKVTLLNVREAVLYALPAPLVRVLVGPVAEQTISKSDILRDFSVDTQRQNSVNYLVREAVKQLHLGIDASIDASQETGVAVSDVTPTQQPALAVAVICGFLDNTAVLMNTRTPAIITHQDDLYVTMKKMNDAANGSNLQITLYYKGSDGSLQAGGGMDGIPVPKGL